MHIRRERMRTRAIDKAALLLRAPILFGTINI
jgi:hypothetical protein